MTSGAFSTETAVMTQAASHVRDINSQITSELSSLKSAVEEAESHWKGTGASAFQSLMQQWSDDSAKLNQALASIADQLTQSSSSYSTQDEDNRQAITGAGGGLNAT